jgi:site-specific recombinase XerD
MAERDVGKSTKLVRPIGKACAILKRRPCSLLYQPGGAMSTNLSCDGQGTGTSFDPYIKSFEDSLTKRRYTRGTITTYRVFVRRFTILVQRRGIDPEQLTVKRATELTSDKRVRRRHGSGHVARKFVEHLIEIGVVAAPSPAPKQIDRANLQREFEDYLRRDRGLSERSIYDCWRVASHFLDHRFGANPDELDRITHGDVVAFIRYNIKGKPPFNNKIRPVGLRNFLRYIFKCNLTPTNLALSVPSVARRYQARLPRHLKPDQVEAVLAAVRACPKHGRRNYAMILLMARLGLRAPEVVAIRLDDIDWRAGELLVRGKGQRHDRVPIPPDVGEALVAYIRNDRVSDGRALFVTERAPRGPFKNGTEINGILKIAFARCGVKPPCPYVGSHVVRHSLATNMVLRGASLAEVGNMLRHRSRASTMIYARLDIDTLRSLAQPWPAGSAQ